MAEPTVFVIDDDADLRIAIDSLLRSVGLKVEIFASAEAFLGSGRCGAPGCLLLDIRLTGLSGVRLQTRLRQEGDAVPIVFMSGHADVETAVQAMKNGAVDFLTKPIRPPDLVEAVNRALEIDAERRREEREMAHLRRGYASLSEREREVMALLVDGASNRAAGAALGLSEATVKAHRARLMQKMGVETFAHLVEAAQRLRSAP